MGKSLSSYLYADEAEIVEGLINNLSWDETRAKAIQDKAQGLIHKIRACKTPPGQLESFLQQYSLNTDEGLALMCLAEALLRVPDKETAGTLIRDKVAAANWLDAAGSSSDWIVKAAGVGLLMTRKTLSGALSHVGEPVIREAMIKAMRILGQQFVLGRDIEEAVQRAQAYKNKCCRISYDMLGEGARTAVDAEKYFEAYKGAIKHIGGYATSGNQKRPGISVKLSALHPRYEYAQKETCVPRLIEKLSALSSLAASNDMALIVDAEEVDRLELSLEIIEGVMADKSLQVWERFGLAVQAYQKRALPLVDHLSGVAKKHKRRLQVRLVKGAYWDTEIKHAQVLGLSDYPVFTRKNNTDISYMACAVKLLKHKDLFTASFGTHNAHTVTAIQEIAQELGAEFEFQRLHGMGENLYDAVDHPVSIYAPVGPHEDLLPYLVRRLLENGANTSFVNKVLDPNEPAEKLAQDPIEKARNRHDIRHPQIPLPADLYAQEEPRGRINSRGMDLADESTVNDLLKSMKSFNGPYEAAPLIGGKKYKDSSPEEVKNPSNNSDNLGLMWPAGKDLIDTAFEVAKEGYKKWSTTDANDRAQALEKFAALMEDETGELMAILSREAGKTIPDARDEIREAVDFCRYYANKGRGVFSSGGYKLPGPTGESNTLILNGRGVFVCISPWNFPLAIFTGQITAALMAGNAVIAKPASPTPLIAMKAVELMHKAGIPKDAMNLMSGSGRMGAQLTAHKDVAGVAFTGSTEVAWEINRTLAAKDGPIVPFIAETGGQNAMIVDSSALPEQVIDDVVLSAFGSAGQRCSALRILCVQDDVADKIIRMLKGAMEELTIGDPRLLSTDVGPVIDENSKGELVSHRQKLEGFGKLVYEVELDDKLEEKGQFFAPCAFEIDSISALEREVFGPILHIVRYSREKLEEIMQDISDTGYGLTFGVHSRIDGAYEELIRNCRAGNAYVNRSMIGAVVGSQPFGGQGISGTGPKAGGPHYLPRFANEKVISIDTTASGGNASLVSIEE